MSQTDVRDVARIKVSSPHTLATPQTAKITPETAVRIDWQREAEDTGGQSFYWCECPLDVSLGGSQDC
jgi:hypothetical protein